MRTRTPQKAELFARALRLGSLGVFAMFACTFMASLVGPAHTSAATSNTINFQARLENNGGAIAPDGTYNVTFHLFNASSSSGSTDTACNTDTSCEWAEQYTYNSGAGSSDARIRVINGYLTVNLGSLTAFGTTINWNQQQWLTMDIGGTVGSGGITWDGQMSPRLLLTATPYAFQAGQLSTTNGSNVATLSFTSPTATDTITLPDASGTVCLQSATACGFAPATGGTGYIQLQASTPGTAQTGNFNISGTGIAATLQASTLDTASAGVLGIGTTNATQINLNQNTVIASGKTLTVNGATTVKTTSSTAFQVQSATSNNVLTVDTSGNNIIIGNDGTPSALTVRGGAATGTNAVGKNITFAASNGTGTGGSGDLIFQTAAPSISTITNDTNSSSRTNSATSLTWSHTTNNSSNRLLVVGITIGDKTKTINSVTYGGANLTKAAGQDCTTNSATCHVELWYLVAPATGTNSVVVTLSGAAQIDAGASTYYNVDPTTPIATSTTSSGNTTPSAVVLSGTTTSQMVIDTFGSDNRINSTNGGNTQRWNTDGTDTSPNAGSSKAGAASSTTMGWNNSSSDWATVVAALNPPAGSSSNSLQDRLHIAASGNIGINTASPQYTLDVNGTGNFGTAVQTPTLQSAAATALTITGNAASTWSTSAGNITLQAGSGTVTLGTSTTLTSTNGLTVSGGTTLTLNSASTNAVSLDSGTTGTVNVGVGANSKTIQIGATNSAITDTIAIGNNSNASGVSNVTVGSTSSTSSTTIQGGTNGVNIGTGGIANTVQIGNTTGAVSQTVQIGTNTTASSTNNITIGSTIAGTTTVQASGINNTISGNSDTIKSTTNSATAFQIQNANGTALFGVDTTTPATNLLTNAGFEVNTIGWVASGTGTTIARQTTASNTYEGLYSLQVNLGTGATDGVQITTSGYSGGSLAAGTYTLSFYAMASASLSGLTIGGFNGGSCSLNQTTVTTAGFVRYYCTITTTGTTTSNLTITVTTISQTMYIDGAQLVSGSNLPPFGYGAIQVRGIINQPLAIQNTVNSTTEFQVQNASGASILNVDAVNGYIGINNRAPSYALDVVGSARIQTSSNSTTALQVQTSSGGSSGTVLDVDTQNTRVGIGTNTPTSMLTIQGSTQDTVLLNTSYNGASFIRPLEALDSSMTSGQNVVFHMGHDFSNYDSGYYGFNYQGLNSANNSVTFGLYGADNLMDLYKNGSLALGATVGTAPSDALYIPTGGSSIYLGNGGGAELNMTGSPTSTSIYSLYGSSTETILNSLSGGDVALKIANATKVFLNSSGNLGLAGNTSPNASLDIGSGTILGAGLSTGTDCSAQNSKLLWSSSTKQFSCGTDRGSVDVIKTSDQSISNTTLTADSALTFSIAANDTYIFNIAMNVTFANAGGVKYEITGPAGATCNVSSIGADTTGTSAELNNAGCAVTGHYAGSGAASVEYIEGSIRNSTNAGSVTLTWAQNASNATATVVKAGSSIVAYKTSGADYAETYYAKDTSVMPGDVVAIDPSLEAGVKKTTTPYESDALGIISTLPGEVIGDGNTTGGVPVPLALAGRVPIKVSTINGAIQPGDYLTPSSIPGVAMKATRPGQMIAKAMASYANDDPNTAGTVMAFVDLSWADPASDSTVAANLQGSDSTADSNVSLNLTTIQGQVNDLTTKINEVEGQIPYLDKSNTFIGTSSNQLEIQNSNGDTLLTADTANMRVIIGSTTNGLVLSASGLMAYGTAQHTKSITLSPQYANAVFDSANDTACINAQTGSMITGFDLTNHTNYYDWSTTGNSPAQCQDVVVQIPIPSDFSSWTDKPLTVSTYSTDPNNDTAALELRDSLGNVVCDFASVTPNSPKVWTQDQLACSLGAGTYTAGQYVTIRVRLSSSLSGHIRLGGMSLQYKSSF